MAKPRRTHPPTGRANGRLPSLAEIQGARDSSPSPPREPLPVPALGGECGGGGEAAAAASEVARMGAHLARRYLWDAEVEPDPFNMPTFDPQLGFPERKERGELSQGGSGEGHRGGGFPASPRPLSPRRYQPMALSKALPTLTGAGPARRKAFPGPRILPCA